MIDTCSTKQAHLQKLSGCSYFLRHRVYTIIQYYPEKGLHGDAQASHLLAVRCCVPRFEE